MKNILLVAFVLSLLLVLAVPVVMADGHCPADAHQSCASVLKGDVAELMPGHVARAHQAAAADLQGGVADLMPEHVRPAN